MRFGRAVQTKRLGIGVDLDDEDTRNMKRQRLNSPLCRDCRPEGGEVRCSTKWLSARSPIVFCIVASKTRVELIQGAREQIVMLPDFARSARHRGSWNALDDDPAWPT